MIQTYDISETYQFNYDRGPVFGGPPSPIPETPMKQFLGCGVRSRIGIAAGLLLNSKWVLGYAQRGFDILTYKTVRSCGRASYPPPNLVFVEPRAGEEAFYLTEKPSRNPAELSSAICFGMPSM